MNKYKYIIILLAISGTVQIFIQGFLFRPVIVGVIFQFAASWLIAYVATQFINKYKERSYINIWVWTYIAMIAFSIIASLDGASY
jgi:hypothetical protein